MPKRADPEDRENQVSTELRLWESDLLRQLWNAKRPMGQGTFGAKYGLGSQGNVGHYIHGRQALNVKAAMAFAAELGCAVEDFSPRLAEQIRLSTSNDPLVEVAEGLAKLPADQKKSTFDFLRYQFEKADADLFGSGKTLQHYLQMIARVLNQDRSGAAAPTNKLSNENQFIDHHPGETPGSLRPKRRRGAGP